MNVQMRAVGGACLKTQLNRTSLSTILLPPLRNILQKKYLPARLLGI